MRQRVQPRPLIGREAQIEQRHGRVAGSECGERASAIASHHDFIIRSKRPFHLRADVVVIDEQR
jgi:hypothetical protein